MQHTGPLALAIVILKAIKNQPEKSRPLRTKICFTLVECLTTPDLAKSLGDYFTQVHMDFLKVTLSFVLHEFPELPQSLFELALRKDMIQQIIATLLAHYRPQAGKHLKGNTDTPTLQHG